MPTDQAFLDAAATQDPRRLAGYTLFESYYEGEQKTQVPDRARLFLENSGIRFSENFCDTICDVFTERLTVTGFLSEEADDEGEDPLGQEIDGWWNDSGMEVGQTIVHHVASLYGDAYLFVHAGDDPVRPIFTVNRPHGIVPRYSSDNPDKLEWVAKRWTTSRKTTDDKGSPLEQTIERLNLYWPDRVEKFYRLAAKDGGGMWLLWADEGDEMEGVVKLDVEGIPVFHFKHRAHGLSHGRSELAGVLPFQDEMNKQVIDLMLTLDAHGFPQDTATGVDPNEVTFDRSMDVWTAKAADAAFGRLAAGDVGPIVESITKVLERMAKKARTPLHLLTGGDQPSGEALKSAEAGLVAKVGNAQVPFGQVWEDAIAYALKLAGRTDAARPTVQWKDPESRSDKDEAEQVALLVEAKLMSRRTAMARLGLDPNDELEQIALEKESALDAMGALLDGGAFGGNGDGGTEMPMQTGQP